MSESILFSSEVTDVLNESAKKIAPHIFLFCNYNPNLLSPISEDGKFLLGVLNLYKLTNDASLAKGVCSIAKEHGWRSLSDKLGDIIRHAEFLRGALAHNYSFRGSSPNSMWLYNCWVKEKTGQSKLTMLVDYGKALDAIENLGQGLTTVLEDFLHQASNCGDQVSIIKAWEEKIVSFYFGGGKGETIIKQQLREFIHAKLAEGGAGKSEINSLYYTNSQLATWAKKFYLDKFDSSLKKYEVLVNMKLCRETLENIAKKCQELEVGKETKQKEIANAQKRNVDELSRYDYLDYYINQAKGRMEIALQNPSQIETLLPEGFIADMVAHDMKVVPPSI